MATSGDNNTAHTTFSVDEEYSNAFRTKSFVDMWAKVHHQLRRTISSPSPSHGHQEGQAEEVKDRRSSHSSPLSYRCYAHLSEFLLEPSQESLLAATASAGDGVAHFHVHSLLLDYFDTTYEACAACTTLLASIDRARSHHRSIRRLLLKLARARLDSNCTAFAKLKSHVELDNPLSPENLAHFRHVHACYGSLVDRLTTANRRIARWAKLIRAAKKASGVILIGACGAAMVAALVIAVHTVVGIGLAAVAAPAVVAGPGAAARSMWGRMAGKSHLKRVGAQVDSAAKGAYIVGRDLDTVSRMVRRAHDEVEHGRDVARLVLRNRERPLVREAARELEGGKEELAGQLDELEEHVYLCLITINRSRRMVAQEMMGGAAPPPAATS
ncbi:putative UPF0496 protein 2 [Phoenix dactylifera]|uniref:UPF0496 protein 2 n=1 Tax=Phoenix dactylifera TaxID=42345 RepID=A0A8B7CTN6_PHODC|nr:putative UPF0496 protein 2 [Phoenix dactylifera]